MRHMNILHLLAGVALTGALFTSCTKDDSLTEIIPTPEPTTATTNEVIEALKTVPIVSGVEVKYNEDHTDSVYFIAFTQPIDHFHPELGSFEQLAALRFKGWDKNVVINTHGYEMLQEADKILPTDLAAHLDANQLNIEHRYFGLSQPEPYDEMKFTYFNAEQESYDLHAIVTALKSTLFKTGKWASTGTSKDGITTALYAYYSDQEGWKDIDVFVPFCAPFMVGTTDSYGNYSCSNYLTSDYLDQVCGTGYAAGSTEAIARERLNQMPYYVCTTPELRRACIAKMAATDPDTYSKVAQQYNNKDLASTGDLEKDLTALFMWEYYNMLFSKFSYVQFIKWSYMVPDPAKVAAKLDAEEMDEFAEFLLMDRDSLLARITAAEAESRTTRATTDETLWQLLTDLRREKSTPYEVQSFTELGFADNTYNQVNNSYLTPAEVTNVLRFLGRQTKFEGIYKQDGGALMKAFREWCYTERSQPIIFVYGKNDPWTGAAPDAAAIEQNDMLEMVVDPKATHQDFFLHSAQYELSSRQAIIAALDKFLK